MFAQVPAMPIAPAAPSAAPAKPAEPNKVVLTIGNEKITEQQYDDMVNAIPAQYQAYARGPGKRSFAEQIAQVKVLAAEAEKKKLDQDPKVRDQLSFQRQNLLAQAMFLSLQENVKVGDTAVEKYFNEHKQDYEVLKGKHILIRVKGAPMQALPGKPELSDDEALAKAKDIRQKLVAGGDFAAIAKADSDDQGSGANGGELGEFKKGMMVPPFEEAAFAAKVGEVTQPVKTPFGYHLIVVESHVTKTLADAGPEMDEGFFGPPAPATPGLGTVTPVPPIPQNK
jgi:peptidyl-prolyl cis-trans isomerase C